MNFNSLVSSTSNVCLASVVFFCSVFFSFTILLSTSSKSADVYSISKQPLPNMKIITESIRYLYSANHLGHVIPKVGIMQYMITQQYIKYNETKFFFTYPNPLSLVFE